MLHRHHYHCWGVACRRLEDSEHAAEYSALIGHSSNIADQSAYGASNDIVSGEGVGAPNIALARALRGRAQSERVGRIARVEWTTAFAAEGICRHVSCVSGFMRRKNPS
jgi:hypothetical protein